MEEGAVLGDFDFGAAELGGMAGLHLATELRGHRLLAVADAEHRYAGSPDLVRGTWRVLRHDRFGPAGEDDRLRGKLGHRLAGVLEGMDFAIDARLAHTASDQLRHLRPEIDDEDLVVRAGDFVVEFLLVHRRSRRKARN
jgi:hypothetical protein